MSLLISQVTAPRGTSQYAVPKAGFPSAGMEEQGQDSVKDLFLWIYWLSAGIIWTGWAAKGRQLAVYVVCGELGSRWKICN